MISYLMAFSRLFSIPYRILFTIFLISFLLFFYGNSQYTLFDNSETHYARVSQEMAQSHHYLSLTFNHQNWYVHPPLYFWLNQPLVKIFGWHDSVIRFQQAFFAFLGLLVLFWIARYFFDSTVAFSSMLILGTSLYYFVIARLGTFDMHLNFFILLTLYLLIIAIYEARFLGIALILASVSVCLGIITKGPIALVQPALVIFPFLIYKKQLRLLLSSYFWIGILIVFSVGFAWHWQQLIIHGKPFFDVALKDYTWYRFLGVVEHQGGAWYYYFVTLLAFLPWIFYFPFAIWYFVQAYRSKVLSRPGLDFGIFSLFAIVIPFVFFSLAQTKLPHYILTIFPFISIMIAFSFTQLSLFHFKLSAAIAAGFSFVLLIVSFFIQYYDVLPKDIIWVHLLFGILFSICLIFYLFTFRFSFERSVRYYFFCLLILAFFLVYLFLPRVEHYKDSRFIVQYIRRCALTPSYHLIGMHSFSPYLMYYLDHDVDFIASFDEMKPLVSHYQDQLIYLIIPKESAREFQQLYPQAHFCIATIQYVLYRI